MKKIVFAVFLLVLQISVLSADERSGVIRELSGTVELRSAASADFVQARVGDIVAENTIISTGFRSMALLEVGCVLIYVRPLTRLSLTEITATQRMENLNVNLQTGRVRVDVNPPAGTRASMSVSSPVAVASVRGTSFEFDTRNLLVVDGKVFFRGNRGYTQQVSAGFAVMLDRKGTVAPSLDNNRSSSPPGLDTASRPAGGIGGSTVDAGGGIGIRYPATP
jgi:hypothetical protein